MIYVLRETPLQYAALSEGRRGGSARAVHEPSPADPSYGDRLICVRYRHDAQRKKRFKTVELLVGERDWEPPPLRFAHDHIVGLRVAFADVAIRDRVKRAGGTWNRDRQVRQLRYDRLIALGLTRLIVDDSASNSGCSEP